MSKVYVERLPEPEPQPGATQAGGSDPNSKSLIPDPLCSEFLLQCLSVTRPLSSVTGHPSTVCRQPTAVWDEVIAIAVRHGLTPLLYARLKENDAQAYVPADVWERMRRTYVASAVRSMCFERDLRAVLRCLRSSGIKVIVLKGAYLAEAVYDDPALRPRVDVDLMVPKADLPRAYAALLDLGRTHRQPQAGASSAEDSHRGLTVGAGIDLCWTFDVPGGRSRLDTACLWDRARPATIAGVEVLALSPEDLLLHLCLHAAHRHGLGDGLRPLCDVCETILRFRSEMDPEVRHGTTEITENRRVRSEHRPVCVRPRTGRPSPDSVFSVASVVDSISVPGIDWTQVVERAQVWGASRYVGLMLHLARGMLGADVPDEVLEQLVPGGINLPVLEAARESVLARTGYMERMPFFGRLGAKSLGEKLKLSWERVFLSRDEMAATYPASRDSKCLCFYYALRLRDVVRAYRFHVEQRRVVRSPDRDRNAALVNWLSGKS